MARLDAPRTGFEPPSLARRFAALMVDWAACVAVSSLFADPVRDGWPPVVVLVGVYAFFVGLFAQTPGMWVAKIRCVSYADSGRIGVFRALLRGLLLVLVVPALIMDGQRRGLHDRLAGSVIVPLDGRSPADTTDRSRS
ncbi:RDD family protein [Polymorphospora sp. 2-325]|uniref:RDD family protein n=1 Tax=Polymorphospora lycopeni TaxID=3140240 RepID=A0ABV5CWQ5_9ACTN